MSAEIVITCNGLLDGNGCVAGHMLHSGSIEPARLRVNTTSMKVARAHADDAGWRLLRQQHAWHDMCRRCAERHGGAH